MKKEQKKTTKKYLHKNSNPLKPPKKNNKNIKKINELLATPPRNKTLNLQTKINRKILNLQKKKNEK